MIPYTNGDFTAAGVIDHWLEFPFSDFGDRTTKVYKMRCRVNAANYSVPALGSSTLASAASAGVSALPSGFTNSQARFCHDTAPTSVSGGVIEFTRVFAVIPKDRTDYSSGVYTSPPEYDTGTQILLYSSFTGGPSRIKKYSYIKTPSQSRTVPARIEYLYTTNPALADIKTMEGFDILESEPDVYGGKYRFFDVTIEDEGEKTVIITGDVDVIEGTRITKWMGDIYEVSTIYKI